MRLKTILVSAVILGITACSGNKTAKKANSLADEHNRLGAWLTTNHPNSDWTPVTLNTFETNLNRYEQTEKQLQGLDGRDGISVRGGRNDLFIAFKRQELKFARDGQAAGASTTTPSPSKTNRQRRADIQPDADAFIDELPADANEVPTA